MKISPLAGRTRFVSQLSTPSYRLLHRGNLVYLQPLKNFRLQLMAIADLHSKTFST